MGSEFQPLFRRTLLGSAIVSAWVSDEGGALAGMEDWMRLCADKDGEANMCCGKWTGDDDYSTPLDLPLLGKGLLVAHLFWPLMAHYRCATSITPLVINTNGAPLVRH